MTSGPVGGPHGAPGQPAQGGQGGQGGPGWNPAPSPPENPYSQPYGYGAAPPPPLHQGAPPAMERPTTVRAGIGAFVASMILGLVASIVTFAGLDDLVAQQLANSDADVALTDEIVRTSIVIAAVIGLVVLALEVLVLWFAWQGRNWARIVLWVLGGLGIVSGVAGLTGDNPLGGFVAALGVFQLLLTLAGVVLLALQPSNEWYRYRGWQRANGLS